MPQNAVSEYIKNRIVKGEVANVSFPVVTYFRVVKHILAIGAP